MPLPVTIIRPSTGSEPFARPHVRSPHVGTFARGTLHVARRTFHNVAHAQSAMLVLPLVLMVAVCCGRRSNVTPDETLRVQLEDDWKYWMAQYPEFATIAGYTGENARWTDYSQAAVDARGGYLRKVSSGLHPSTAADSRPAISSITTCIATC